MADNNFRPPAREKTALDNNKIHLYAPNSVGKRASLQFQLIKNNPRFVVYTNDPDDTTDYGKITAATTIPGFFSVLNLIRIALTKTEKWKDKVDCKGFSWAGGKRSETMGVLSSIIVGRDEDGTIWLTISAPRRPNIKFPFGPDDFHGYVHGDGSAFEKPELSQLYAQTYLDFLAPIMTQLAVDKYIHPEPKPDNRNGGGNNRGNNSGGGGGNRNTEVADDDIPW